MKPRVHKYANGGKVEKEAKKKKKPTPKMLGTGTAASAADALKNTRARQMEKLGLKHGGMVKPEKAKGGPPKQITTPGKAGDSGPGGAHPGKNPKRKKK